MRMLGRVYAGALGLTLLAGSATADIFEHVTSDALLVVRVNKIQQVNDKFGKLARDFGVGMVAPDAINPLRALERELPLGGVDLGGDAAIVLIDLPDDGSQPLFYALLPVTDFAAFTGGLPNVREQNGLKVFEENGDPVFIGDWGGYAALSNQAELVRRRPETAARATGASAKALSGKDLAIWVNFPKVRQITAEALNEGKQKLLEDMTREIAADPDSARYVPLATAVFNQAFNVVESFLRDADSAVVNLNLDAEGIGYGLTVQLKEGTYLGNAVSAIRPPTQPLLRGLPAGRLLLAGGFANDGAVLEKVVGDLLEPIRPQIAELGDEGAELLPLIDDYITVSRATTGGGFVVFTPEIAIGAKPILKAAQVYSGDVETMHRLTGDMTVRTSAAMAKLNLQEADMLPVYQQNAAKIAGVNWSLLEVKLPENPQTPEEMQAAQIMQILYGPEGPKTYMGTVGDKFVSVLGLTEDEIGAVVNAVRGNDTALAENPLIRQISAKLPQGRRVGEFYIFLDQFIGTGLAVANEFGMRANVRLPENLPPLGVVVQTDGPALVIEGYVPSVLIEGLISTGMQFMMQMQGGMRPGGGL